MISLKLFWIFKYLCNRHFESDSFSLYFINWRFLILFIYMGLYINNEDHSNAEERKLLPDYYKIILKILILITFWGMLFYPHLSKNIQLEIEYCNHVHVRDCAEPFKLNILQNNTCSFVCKCTSIHFLLWRIPIVFKDLDTTPNIYNFGYLCDIDKWVEHKRCREVSRGRKESKLAC